MPFGIRKILMLVFRRENDTISSNRLVNSRRNLVSKKLGDRYIQRYPFSILITTLVPLR